MSLRAKRSNLALSYAEIATSPLQAPRNDKHGNTSSPVVISSAARNPYYDPREFTLNGSKKDLFPRGPYTLNIDTSRDNADLRRDSRFRFHPPPIGDEPNQADPTEENANDQPDRGDRQQKHRRDHNDDHPARERTSAVICDQSSAQSPDKLHTGLDRDKDVRK